jgi:hypothetical protein
LIIERLVVTHAADDDNLYFLGDEAGPGWVRFETHPGGQPPFLIEDDHQVWTSEVAEAAATVVSCLRSGDVDSGDDVA